jgi:type I restriction enzyme S subunit
MAKIHVPVPPLPVQEEIVRILDKFTQLEAELEAELEARKKQYSHYRNALLSFENPEDAVGIEWAALKNVAKIKNGKDWKTAGRGKVPVYGSGGIMSQTVSKIAYSKPTVLIPRKGTITNIFYTEKPFWNVDTIYYTEIDNSLILPKFFFYFMDNFDLKKLDTGKSGRPSLTQSVLNEIKIPLPPLEKQKEIVEILDKFEKLTSDISQGLPAEITARRKQYEYYRNKLLTFNELP